MHADVLRALAHVQRVVGRAFAARVDLNPDVDQLGEEPHDPYAYSHVPRHPRRPLLSGAVALAEPDEDD
jgi:hypothetical protein